MPIMRRQYTIDVSGISGLRDRRHITLSLYAHDVANATTGFAIPGTSICQEVRAELRRLGRIDKQQRLHFKFKDLRVV